MSFFKKRNLQEWFYDRGFFLILAFGLAVLAWLFVHSGQTTRLERTLKIEYINLPMSLTYSKAPRQEVKVLVTGSFHRIRSLEDEDLTYLVDLRNARVGTKVIEVDLSRMRLPFDVRISNPNPARFPIEFEDLISRDLKAVPIYEGKLEEGYEISSVRIEPERISLSGPSSVVASLEQIAVPISLHGKRESFSTQVSLTPLPQVEMIESVFVDVTIEEVQVERVYREVPVVSDTEGAVIQVNPPTASLTLQGSQTQLNAIESSLVIRVPTEGLSRGKYRLRGVLELPESVEVLNFEPDTFIVEVLQ